MKKDAEDDESSRESDDEETPEQEKERNSGGDKKNARNRWEIRDERGIRGKITSGQMER